MRNADVQGRIGRAGAGAPGLRLGGIALVLLALGGCVNLRPTQKAFAPDEYDMRHPIRLADAPRHLDVFPSGPALDHRQRQDIAAFAGEHARHGRSMMMAAVPQGGRHAHAALGAIRQALAAGGYRGGLQVQPYAADGGRGAAPVRLSFLRLQAKVESQCGLWPADLAGSKEAETWHNRPYHNLGCAYQTMIAAQVADPIDLVRPRPEGPIDVGKRTKDIEALRKGEDPSTQWKKDDAKVQDAQGKN